MADEWAEVPLGELVDPQRGISYGIVQPGKPVKSGVPIVRVSDVRNGRIDVRSPLCVSPEIERPYGRTRLRGGELLITIVGTIGETAIVPMELAGWNVARAIAVLPVRPEIGSYWVQLGLKAAGAASMIPEPFEYDSSGHLESWRPCEASNWTPRKTGGVGG